MAVNSIIPPFDTFKDIDGRPLDRGFIYIGEPGLDAEANPKQAYWDAELSVPASQPIETISGFASNSGSPATVYVDGDYSITVKDRKLNVVQQATNVAARRETPTYTFASRSAFVAWVAAGNTAPDGSIASDGTVQYVADSTATAISDLNGWLPFGDCEPQHFGAVADGVTNDGAALQGWLDYIAGSMGRMRSGIYRSEIGLSVEPGTTIFGDGPGQWDTSNIQGANRKDMSGSIILFVGVGPKDKEVLGVTDCRTAGGVIANPSSINANDAEYKLTNFYNDDADTTTGEAATKKQFSVAVHVKPGNKTIIKGVRVMLSFDGGASTDGHVNTYSYASGYSGLPSGLGTSDWDVGIWLENANDFVGEDVTCVGYWRMVGVLHTAVGPNAASSLDEEQTQIEVNRSAERARLSRCVFSGMVGYAYRAGDFFRVLARTSSTVDVEWADNHPFSVSDLNGRFRAGDTSQTSMSFTGVSYVSGSPARLRLTGVTPDPTTVSQLDPSNPDSKICPLTGTIGVAGTVFDECVITGLNHASVERSTEVVGVTLRPSAAVEISGHAARRFLFTATRVWGVDDVAFHIHHCDSISLDGLCLIESVNSLSGVGVGARFITSPDETENTRVTNPSGATFEVNINELTSLGFVDLRPDYSNVFGANTRFTDGADNGLFEPQIHFVRQAVQPSSNNGGATLLAPSGRAAGLGSESDSQLRAYFDSSSEKFIIRYWNGSNFVTLAEFNAPGNRSLFYEPAQFDDRAYMLKFVTHGSSVLHTISGGAITAGNGFVAVDTEGGAATDDLDTINGGQSGDEIILRTASSARDVVLKDGTGNLALAGDFTLSTVRDTIRLIYTGSQWLELSRSSNG